MRLLVQTLTRKALGWMLRLGDLTTMIISNVLENRLSIAAVQNRELKTTFSPPAYKWNTGNCGYGQLTGAERDGVDRDEWKERNTLK